MFGRCPVDLTEYARRAAGRLSGGWARRLQLAAALIHSPKLILLDEPTAGLDAMFRQEVWQRIGRLAAQGRASSSALMIWPRPNAAPRPPSFRKGELSQWVRLNRLHGAHRRPPFRCREAARAYSANVWKSSPESSQAIHKAPVCALSLTRKRKRVCSGWRVAIVPALPACRCGLRTRCLPFRVGEPRHECPWWMAPNRPNDVSGSRRSAASYSRSHDHFVDPPGPGDSNRALWLCGKSRSKEYSDSDCWRPQWSGAAAP